MRRFLSLLVHAGGHPSGGDTQRPRSPRRGRPHPHTGHCSARAERAAGSGGGAVLTRDT